MTSEMAMTELARQQHGLVTLDQLRELDFSDRQIDYRVSAGRLERLEPRLYRIRGVPESWEQRVLGACLSAGPGAVACRRTAAALWELWRPPTRPVEIAVPRPRDPDWGSATLFRSTDIVAAHRTVVSGIPTTTVPRTLVDLGAVAAPWLVDEAVDRAIGRGLTSTTELDAMLRAVARRGRRGVGPLRQSVAHMVDGVESVLEAKLVRLVLRSDLPQPDVQHRVALGPDDVARIDLAYPHLKIAIEADGQEAHVTRQAFERDRIRQNRLQQLGWVILRFTWHQVTRQEGYVIAHVRDALKARTREPLRS